MAKTAIISVDQFIKKFGFTVPRELPEDVAILDGWEKLAHGKNVQLSLGDAYMQTWKYRAGDGKIKTFNLICSLDNATHVMGSMKARLIKNGKPELAERYPKFMPLRKAIKMFKDRQKKSDKLQNEVKAFYDAIDLIELSDRWIPQDKFAEMSLEELHSALRRNEFHPVEESDEGRANYLQKFLDRFEPFRDKWNAEVDEVDFIIQSHFKDLSDEWYSMKNNERPKKCRVVMRKHADCWFYLCIPYDATAYFKEHMYQQLAAADDNYFPRTHDLTVALIDAYYWSVTVPELKRRQEAEKDAMAKVYQMSTRDATGSAEGINTVIGKLDEAEKKKNATLTKKIELTSTTDSEKKPG